MTNLNDPPENAFAAAFDAMSERIRRNRADDFGGAMLVVTPDGQVVDVLLIGSKPDAEHFWVTVRGKLGEAADAAIAKLQNDQRLGFRSA